MKNVWVVGEALIDLVPSATGETHPVVGGGPANTAKAVAQLGLSSYFIGGVSKDDFGSLIRNELVKSGVNLSLAHSSELPSAIARVLLDENGNAKFQFELDNTATFDFANSWLPTGEPLAIHIGSLATIVQPGAEQLLQWIGNFSVPIVFDPNVRTSVLGDVIQYRSAIEMWVAQSSVVKISEDDISFLYPNRDYLEIANNWLSQGIQLVVITRGADGLIGVTKKSHSLVAAVKVNVVDTIGAGDTVGAVVVEAIAKYGLEALENERLTMVLERAAKAAALTCARAGAQPPNRGEL